MTDQNGNVTEYVYDALNRVTAVVRPNSTKTEIVYDEEDHVTKLENLCSECGAVISSYEYSYNAQGYIVKETAVELEAGTHKALSFEEWHGTGSGADGNCGSGDTAGSMHCHKEKSVTTTRTYEYNENWQLTRCTEKTEGSATVVHNYTYDKVGNRTVYERLENGVTKAKYKYEYNDSNQLVKKKNAKIWGDPGVVYTYDEDGNLIKKSDKTNHSAAITYEYAAENRLAVVKKGGTVMMAALYDGDGNRVFQIDNTYKWEDCYGDDVLIPKSGRTEDGSSPQEQLASLVKNGVDSKSYTLTEYVNDVNRENTQVLSEYGADNVMRQTYVYGAADTNNRISVEKGTETSYYLYDGRGSVSGLQSMGGTLTNSYRYDAYGNLTSGTPDGVNYYGYNAESTNTKTELQYLRARYYDAETGRFTTEDKDLGTTENPLTRNRYVYVLDNPLNYYDPTGRKRKQLLEKKSGKQGKSLANLKSRKNFATAFSDSLTDMKRTLFNTSTAQPKTIYEFSTATALGEQAYYMQKQETGQLSSQVGINTKNLNSFYEYRTAAIKRNVEREVCQVTKEINMDTVAKVAIGAGVLIGLGTVAYFTAAPVAVLGFSTAVIGGISGGLQSGAMGKDVLNGTVSGILNGATVGMLMGTGTTPYLAQLGGGFVGSMSNMIFSDSEKKDVWFDIVFPTLTQMAVGGFMGQVTGMAMEDTSETALKIVGEGITTYLSEVYGGTASITVGIIGDVVKNSDETQEKEELKKETGIVKPFNTEQNFAY